MIVRFDKRGQEVPGRLLSVDVFRGLIVLILASGGLGLSRAARHFPGNRFWEFLAYQSRHAPWIGCSMADLLQPMFLFIAGAALPLAHANRRLRGQSECQLIGRAVRRAAFFLLLGVIFEAAKSGELTICFINVLSQIGLGYIFVALLAERSFRTQLVAVAVILFGVWLAFALYPCSIGAGAVDPSRGQLSGFFAHWNKHDNIAAALDRLLLNRLPRSRPFYRQLGGYQTLNFIPSIATMLLGVMAGRLLLGWHAPGNKAGRLLGGGLISFGMGIILSSTVCPCIKRLWTPSWTLLSGGAALMVLAGLYWLIDVRRCNRWCRPLAGIGRRTLPLFCVCEWAECLKPLLRHASWIRGDAGFGRQPLFRGLELFGAIVLPAMLLLFLWWIVRRVRRLARSSQSRRWPELAKSFHSAPPTRLCHDYAACNDFRPPETIFHFDTQGRASQDPSLRRTLQRESGL